MFSKRHYIEIAKALKGSDYSLILKFANMFQKYNKLFNEDKFINACR